MQTFIKSRETNGNSANYKVLIGYFSCWKISFILLFAFGVSQTLSAQEILISKDISIRNHFSYSIIGKINDRILLYRDQGFNKDIDVFDLSMNHKFNSQLMLEDKKALIHDMVGRDSLFQIVYSYSKRDTVLTCIRNYNERLQLQDSAIVAKRNKTTVKSKLQSLVSENGQKMVIYNADKNRALEIMCIDLYEMTLDWKQKFALPNVDMVGDFIEAILSDQGQLFMVFDQNKISFRKQKHKIKLLFIENGLGESIDLEFEENLAMGLNMAVDNINNRLVISGLYNKKGDHRIDGLYILNEKIRNLTASNVLMFFPFTESFLNEISSNRKKQKKQLEHFNLNNLILRNDGGVLLFAEMSKVYNRRNPYNGVFPSTRDTYGRRGWTDFYNEDVIVMAFDKDSKLDWKTVLYKKQFSQDDEGAYSSYFLFSTPSRIRMLYNDEIKKNNTVSEYMLDPLGNQIRNSLLSTAYQNLKLRFTGAVQVASNVIIVPSETSYNVNLVKIEY